MKVKLTNTITLGSETYPAGTIVDVNLAGGLCVHLSHTYQQYWVGPEAFEPIHEPVQPTPEPAKGLPAIFGQDLKSLTVEFK